MVKVEDEFFQIPKSPDSSMIEEPKSKKIMQSLKISSVIKLKNNEEKNVIKKTNGTVRALSNSSLSFAEDKDDVPLSARVKNSNSTIVRKNNGSEEIIHSCEICHQVFQRKSKLSSHLVKHSNSRPHKCEICFKAFKTSIYLARHMETHEDPLEFHSCDLCDFKARVKSYLKVHYIRKHTYDYNYTCEHCGKMFKVQSDFTTHIKDHETEFLVCDICGRSYPNKSSLYFHKQYKHKTRVNDFECKVCKKRFANKVNLHNHTLLHKAKYICELCGTELKSQYGLTKHLRTHSEEKPYSCAICGHGFRTLTSQKIHLLTHVGERPYVCEICGKTFTQRSPMMLHRKTQHPGYHPPPPPIKITNLLHGVEDQIVVHKTTQ